MPPLGGALLDRSHHPARGLFAPTKMQPLTSPEFRRFPLTTLTTAPPMPTTGAHPPSAPRTVTVRRSVRGTGSAVRSRFTVSTTRWGSAVHRAQLNRAGRPPVRIRAPSSLPVAARGARHCRTTTRAWGRPRHRRPRRRHAGSSRRSGPARRNTVIKCMQPGDRPGGLRAGAVGVHRADRSAAREPDPTLGAGRPPLLRRHSIPGASRGHHGRRPSPGGARGRHRAGADHRRPGRCRRRGVAQARQA